jgi:hypothetical protein
MSRHRKSIRITRRFKRREDVMERRDFLKFALGVAASAAVLGARAQAAPLAPHSLNDDALRAAGQDAHPAVTTEDEVDHLKPEQVRWGHGHGWGHGHHYGWHHRHWGWHRRHWGWHRRWHRHHWHRRYW